MSSPRVVTVRYEVVGSTTRAYVYLDNGSTAYGEKVSDFLGLSDPDEADKMIAYERAMKKALRK